MRRIGSVAAWLVLVSGLLQSRPAAAFDLDGAWTTDVDRCNQVFVMNKEAKRLDFGEFPGVYGGGFIAEPDRLRSKFASCKIKTKQEKGRDLNFVAACATDIMLSDVQFVLRIVDDDKVVRLFPGLDGIELEYHRCRL